MPNRSRHTARTSPSPSLLTTRSVRSPFTCVTGFRPLRVIRPSSVSRERMKERAKREITSGTGWVSVLMRRCAGPGPTAHEALVLGPLPEAPSDPRGYGASHERS